MVAVSKELTTYTYQDIQAISFLCDVAYDGGESSYFKRLEDLAWKIEFLTDSPFTQSFGVKASNGSLTVIAFAGTKIMGNFHTILQNMDALPSDSKAYFETLPISGALHHGMATYYTNIKKAYNSFLLDSFDRNLKLVLCGHSLGGAIAQLHALDIVNACHREPEKYPTNFCSIFTLGAPAFLDSSLAAYLDTHFTGSSHLRVSFDNDLISNYTRGPGHNLFPLHKSNDGKGPFVHAGHEISLQGEGFMAHRCAHYIESIIKHEGK